MVSLKNRTKSLNFEPFFNENALISLKSKVFFNVFGAKFNGFRQKFSDIETEILRFAAKLNAGRIHPQGSLGSREETIADPRFGGDVNGF